MPNIKINNYCNTNQKISLCKKNDSKILSKLNNETIKHKIMEYININSEYLDLSNIELDLLSDDIFNLSSFRHRLHKLSLDGNVLRNIPESIGNLLELGSLYLSQNRLTTLPESIRNLSKLNDLSLSENQLTYLPESIGNLLELGSLYLSQNRLTTLPESIRNLSKLNDLSLSENQLTYLPVSIGNLSKLNNLSISHNRLTSLPVSIGNLSKLNNLSISHNRLTSLPVSIGNLSKLNDLYLSHNQLTSLPVSIGNLSKLNDLSLSHNRLTSLPESIGNLSKLNDLSLSENQLTYLPVSIGNLLELNSLYLLQNRLTTLPESIGNLSKLNDLYLSENQLTYLPESIGNLSKLNNLYLSENQLTYLPESIGNLSKLNDLYLSHNRLTSLPASIGNLQELQVLNLSNNPNLPSLPIEIFNLPNNCTINISGCNFSQHFLNILRERTNQANYRGPQISHAVNTSIEESLQRLYAIIDRTPNELLKLNRSETLCIWLHKLKDAADYQQPQKKEFITKIISYLEKANVDEKFRNTFFATIDDAVGSCGDRIALSVLQLGVNYQLETIDLNNTRELAHLLIRGILALEILHKIAQEKVKTLQFVDEIEVYLGYPIKLKEQLDLPIDITNMCFFNCSALTDSDLETAKNIVLASITDQEECLNFLITQPKWLKSLKYNYAEEYLSIKHTKRNDLKSDNPDYVEIDNTYKKELKYLTVRALELE